MNLINKKVCRGIGILILLTLYLGLCFEAAALEEMAVGDFHELEGGYGIKVEGADVESGKASFLLLKEDRVVDEKHVNNGERFRLHDEEIFYFEATLDSVFRREDTIMVHLVDYGWWWPDDYSVDLIIFLICCLAIGLTLFFIIYRKRKRPSGGQKQKLIGPDVNAQKIEEYRAKMEEWEKEGYDVSALKEVLEGKK